MTTAPPAHERRGRGAPVILLHGIGAGAAMFVRQLETLSNDFDVIAWNMPGFADSPPCEGMLTFDVLVDRLKVLLDHLGLSRAHLVGHSIGGMIAQAFAAAHPDRVGSVVLSATTSAFGSRDGAFQKTFLADRLKPLDDGRTIPELAAEFVPDLVGSGAHPAAVDIAREAMSALSEATYRQVLTCLVTFNMYKEFGELRPPILLVAGEEDRNAPARTMRRMAERHPRARFVEIAKAGHLAPLEQPEAFNAVVTEFLSARSGNPGAGPA